ncbi:MAG: SMC-Scp complex subunit ScpB [Candidatus Omnitrophica bacterium CG11_big_fil_rev_8_21_14_0_20_64_10]|nr:MAG: SMC-Scp complex subunit ScpB [Candidatus Omnitrophica bacterium CG11_big_fil_rev_8_21_14_0_20_64_10]
MEWAEAKRVLEAVLLVSEKPVRPDQLGELFPQGFGEGKIRQLFEELRAEYSQGRGIQIVEVAGGFQFVTHPDLYEHVSKLNKRVRAIRLSKPSLESLAIIAYRQPLTRAEIEQIRGVDCSGVLDTLLRPGFIKVVGRKEVVGRPLLYGTTPEFLEHFGLKNLKELPSLEALQGEPGVLREVTGIEAAEEHRAEEAAEREEPAEETAEQVPAAGGETLSEEEKPRE